MFSDFKSGDELDICTDYSYQSGLMTDMWTFRDGSAIRKTRFTDNYYVSRVHNNEELPLKYIVIGIHLGNVPSIRLEIAKTPEEKRVLDLDINAIPLSDLNNKDGGWIMKSYCT